MEPKRNHTQFLKNHSHRVVRKEANSDSDLQFRHRFYKKKTIRFKRGGKSLQFGHIICGKKALKGDFREQANSDSDLQFRHRFCKKKDIGQANPDSDLLTVWTHNLQKKRLRKGILGIRQILIVTYSLDTEFAKKGH